MNTPKQKAEELILLHMQYTPAQEEYEFPYAKKAAMITVNEIIASEPIKNSLRYWFEVKTEIENL